jgi:hypothetical protein
MALRTHRLMTQVTSASCLLLGLFSATSSEAAVTEPNGLAVPIDQSKSLDYFDTRRYTAATLGIQSLLDTWEDAGTVDAYADASATNVVFSPLCGLTGSMILRGGSCQVDFGWYCVDDAPGAEVIHPLVTAADIVKYHDVTLKSVLPTLGSPPSPLNQWTELQNDDKGFVPTVQSGFLQPVIGSGSLDKVRESPEYQACKSGKIGFAFKGVPTSICPMSKFSEPSRNQISSFDKKPWINAVVYASKKNPGSFYIAFEDMPTTAGSFTPALKEVKSAFPQMTNKNNGWEDWKNDGDFNDFVFKVDGILCEGGGQACTPTDGAGNPLLGACSLGVTACSEVKGQSGACIQKVPPSPEICDGWDNDCDGTADNGAGLCKEGFVCDNGKCVGGCGSPEFPCDEGLVCETTGRLANFCVSQKCKGVVCENGQRCDDVTGTCVGGCEGVVCPQNMECIAGNCIDLCASVKCPSSFVCERGACIPSCVCLPCTDESRSYCDTGTGRCIDQACAGVVCDQYLTCKGGTCVNPCEPNPCNGSTCTALPNGSIACAGTTNPGTATGTDVSTGTNTDVSTSTHTDISTTPTTDTNTNTNGNNGSPTFNNGGDGCGCRVVAPSTERRGALLLALFGLATTALRLRKRATTK